MRKIFVSVVLALFVLCGNAFAEVEPDTELHDIIGGLYSLTCAAALNGETQPHINQLRKYFADVPNDWYSTVQLSTESNAVWAGVAVGKFSSARKFLREHSAELDILDSPGGYAWLGGAYAWMKAADIVNGKLKPSGIIASRGKGRDSGLVFLSTKGQESWWTASPSFTPQAAKDVISRWGVKNAPELHRPSGVHGQSVYESVKPSDVKKPGDMHVGRRKSSFDVRMDLGTDVIFDPMPNRVRNSR